MTSPPRKDFGTRQPEQPPESPSRKRSNQVALLLMGTVALGGSAYALMPSEQCDPNRSAIEQPGCRQNGSSSWSSSGSHYYGGGSGGGSSTRANFASTDNSSSSSGSHSSSSVSSSSISRGGFGTFAAHFSGGG